MTRRGAARLIEGLLEHLAKLHRHVLHLLLLLCDLRVLAGELLRLLAPRLLKLQSGALELVLELVDLILEQVDAREELLLHALVLSRHV